MKLNNEGIVMRLAVILLLLTGPGAYAQRPATSPSSTESFIIDEYDFTWTVIKIGEATLKVAKDQETTKVAISSRNDYFSMSPADAEKVGAVLADTDKYYAKMKGAKADVNETVAAGECNVFFHQSIQYGFSVSLSGKESLSFSRVSLDRKAANALAPHLKKSVAMAKYVDKVIDAAVGNP